ncbi:hypothetical protein PBCVNEJV1_186R [Paramecium bursaria Chlorella virus NE-JV-1]|nr:hypothetical protein PBCVNEJV1_186R [Paramecium bursaria Chlorella virus NE-JV-1]
MKKEKIRVPYVGVIKYENLEIDYSMERLLFSFEYAKDKRISWIVEKPYVLAYPNFQKMTEYELWWFYNYTIVPQMRGYFNFINHHKMFACINEQQ